MSPNDKPQRGLRKFYPPPPEVVENLIQFVLPNGALLSVSRILHQGVTTTEVAVVNGAGGFVPLSEWRPEEPSRFIDENILLIGTSAGDIRRELEFAEQWGMNNRRMYWDKGSGFHFAPE